MKHLKQVLPQFPDLSFTYKVLRQRREFVARLEANHRGKANAIKSSRIERALKLSGSQVRELRALCQRMRIPICSDTQAGYWFGDGADVKRTRQQYLSRISQIMLCVRGLEEFEAGENQIEIIDHWGMRL